MFFLTKCLVAKSFDFHYGKQISISILNPSHKPYSFPTVQKRAFYPYFTPNNRGGLGYYFCVHFGSQSHRLSSLQIPKAIGLDAGICSFCCIWSNLDFLCGYCTFFLKKNQKIDSGVKLATQTDYFL